MAGYPVHHLHISMHRKNPFHITNPNTTIPTSIYFRSIQSTPDPSANPPQPSANPNLSANPSAGLSFTPSAIPATGNPQPINATMMANAINDLVKSNLPSRVKIREPDPFNSSDPKKLCTFLLQCKLNVKSGF